MFPLTILESFIKGAWHEIGWHADTPKRLDDLREHGRRLAEYGGRYRLVRPSLYAGQQPAVIHEFGA